MAPAMSRSEGNTGQAPLTFAVTLSSAYDAPVTVDWATTDISATTVSDYQAQSGTLTFAPGVTTKSITVLVNGDRLAEPDETFHVNLSGATSAVINHGVSVGTIVDDEPRISITDATRAEGKRGKTTLFIGVLASVNQHITLFMDDGTPVRATMDCTFREFDSDSDTVRDELNSPDVDKRYVVRPGDTLTRIAAELYSDQSLWRVIADANGIDNPRRLTPGQVLLIPKLT